MVAESGLTGPGLPALLSGFTYSGTGGNAGGLQSFTLQGLTPGQSYQFRLYIRVWDTEGSSRPILINVTNGEEVNTGGVVPEDRPGDVLGHDNQHAVYYISVDYVAAGSELVAQLSRRLARVRGAQSLQGCHRARHASWPTRRWQSRRLRRH